MVDYDGLDIGLPLISDLTNLLVKVKPQVVGGASY